MKPRALSLTFLLSFSLGRVSAAIPTFQHDVLPWLEKNCVACHGAKPMGGLDLRTLESAMSGGSKGPAIVPGKPDQSLLFTMVDSGKMPMSGPPVPAAAKVVLREWIEKGLFPGQAAGKRKKHWAFQKPVKPAIPKVRAASRIRTPVDAFVLQKLEASGWTLQNDASPATLMRRATFDLTGLPPSPEDVDSLVKDPSPKAYEDLLDRLLASPQYGERWGRHWLDVAGYVESTGSPTDEVRPVAWRYRDYVIRSIQADKPYDKFLLEQFAGDQLANYQGGGPRSISTTFTGQVTDMEAGERPSPRQMELLIATGFLRAAPDGSDNQTIEQVDKWHDALQVATEVPVKAVLGLQMACARCHDHKFDPILQEDYYRLVSVFQPAYDPAKWLASNIHFGPWPARYVYDAPPEQVRAYGDFVLKHAPLAEKAKKELNDAYRLAKAKLPNSGPEPSNSALEQMFPEIAAKAREYKRLEKEIEQKAPQRIWALWDISREPSETHLLHRGDYRTPARTVKPGVPKFLDDPQHPVDFTASDASWHHSGRRLRLAEWLTRPDHPLTARVFVNRVWQYHFGQGIVGTPDDFGSQGAPPTHPDLLDWLATGFVENGWSLRWLHKQMMLSSTYRQDSRGEAGKMAADPSNKLLWRKQPLRLEAEAIRDAMLLVAGQLDLRSFGEPVALRSLGDGQPAAVGTGGGAQRRSIYLRTRRTELDNFLQVFDAPLVETNVPVRFRSATAQQSLALMNGPLTMGAAAAFAARVRGEAPGEIEAIHKAYRLAFQRQPSEEEVSLAFSLIRDAGDRDGAWRTFCQALFGANEFLYVF